MWNIYLDNSATTPVAGDVADTVYAVLKDTFGNPSSLHGKGSDAYKCIGVARHQVAQILSAKTDRIHFTAGGTESNNLAIFGAAYGNKAVGKKLVTTAIEHSSVLASFAELSRQGFDVTYVAPQADNGLNIRAQDVIDAVDDDTALVSFMYVNNETGAILPVREIIKGVREKNPRTLIHCDCVQGFGKLPFKLFDYDVDLLSASAHKIHGPKGIGCLYVKDRIRIAPRLFGGAQEYGVRPGTENVALIAGFGKACSLALPEIKENLEYVSGLRARLQQRLEEIPCVRLNSPENHSPYLLNFSLDGFEASDIITHMSVKGIYVSAGSACSRGARSYVLKASGLKESLCAGAVRLSLSHLNTLEEIDIFVDELKSFVLNK